MTDAAGVETTHGEEVERLLEAARETRAKVIDCWAATRAGDGRISIRLVQPIPGVPGEEDWTVWFATWRSSRKAQEIRETGQLTLGYQHNESRAYVALYGRVALIEDRAEIRGRWTDGFRRFFPGGPEDPETIFVRFNTDRIELCVRGVTPEPFGSEYSILVRDDQRRWNVVEARARNLLGD